LQKLHGKDKIMKHKTVKTYIGKLLRRYPHKKRYEGVAKDLGVSARYIRHLEKGELTPSGPLRKLIKVVLNQK